MNHCDPMIARGGDIDRRVSRSRRGNELEIGKALNDVAGQRGPLAHDTNDIKRQQPLNHGVRIGEVVLKYGDVRSIAEHRPIGALKRHILVIVQNSDLVLLHWHPSRSACKRLSDCENDPAEGAALNEVTQSICRLSQRERLCHDGLDRPGLKQWKNDAPCGAPCRRRLCEQGEALHTRALPDQIRDVDGCLAARGVAQCSQTSSHCERAESLAQDFSADCVDHDVGAITFRDPANTIAELLHRKVDHFIETQRACLLRLRMIGRG